jgi:DNA-directed RNA polymerase subunit RPC12/RpoP
MKATLTCKNCQKQFEHDVTITPVVCPHCGQKHEIDLKPIDPVSAPKNTGTGE